MQRKYIILFSVGVSNILIAGAPSSGKTTILKGFVQARWRRHSVALVDERNEIAAVYRGIPQNDVGNCTDVLDGFPKYEEYRQR